MCILSLSFILLSSYLLVSIVKARMPVRNTFPILFLLISFSQLVLSFEIMSLFSQIGTNQLIFLNVIFFVISFIFWIFNKKPLYVPEIKCDLKHIYTAIKIDKVLVLIFGVFLVSIVIGLFNSIFLPITFGDALNYYFTRVTTWIQDGNINHFVTPDIRELIMPVNMEFLYAWIFLFFKKETGTSIFSYISFINLLYVMYNLLGLFHVSIRRRIWGVISFSSFAIISHMISVPCADIFIGSLLLSGLYLFILYAKNNNLLLLFFSTLATVLAFGTKTTAMIAYPSIIFLMIIFLFLYKCSDKKKTAIYYFLFLMLNFLLFSSYNFILNFIQFANPLTSKDAYLVNHFYGGLKCYLFNLLNYFYLTFDFSGIENFDFYNNAITFLRNKTFIVFGISPVACCSKLFDSFYVFDSELSMTKSYLGALGLFLFFPSILISLRNCIFIKKSLLRPNRVFLSIFAIAYIFNILLFSKVMIFTSSNSRYLVTFVCLVAPILCFSYIKSNKNILKFLVLYFMFVYLLILPFSKMKNVISDYFALKSKYPQIKNTYELLCYRFNDENIIYNYFFNQKKIKIALIAYQKKSRLFDIEKLKFHGHRIDKFLVENIGEYDLSDYDYIVSNPYKIDSHPSSKNVSAECSRKYTPKCTYYERNFVISDSSNPNLITVSCEVPFEYFSELGFEKTQNIKLKKYVILKNKNK